MLRSFLRKLYHAKLSRELRDAETILELGCGDSSMLQRVKGKFRSTGVDAFPEFIEKSRALGIHDDYILSDLTTLDLPPRSYDVIWSSDVVEHLEWPESVKLVEKMETWAKKKVMIVTPNGWCPTPHTESDANGDMKLAELMRHKCGWTPDDLEKRGYRVYGMDGFKFLRVHRNDKGEWDYGYPDDDFRLKLHRLSYLFTYPFPRTAFRMLAIKDIT